MNDSTKEELLLLCYAQERTCGLTSREFQCLVSMIEEGTIRTANELAEYGIEIEE